MTSIHSLTCVVLISETRPVILQTNSSVVAIASYIYRLVIEQFCLIEQFCSSVKLSNYECNPRLIKRKVAGQYFVILSYSSIVNI